MEGRWVGLSFASSIMAAHLEEEEEEIGGGIYPCLLKAFKRRSRAAWGTVFSSSSSSSFFPFCPFFFLGTISPSLFSSSPSSSSSSSFSRPRCCLSVYLFAPPLHLNKWAGGWVGGLGGWRRQERKPLFFFLLLRRIGGWVGGRVGEERTCGLGGWTPGSSSTLAPPFYSKNPGPPRPFLLLLLLLLLPAQISPY